MVTAPQEEWWHPKSWQLLRGLRLQGSDAPDVDDFEANSNIISLSSWYEPLVAYIMNSWSNVGHTGPGGLAVLN